MATHKELITSRKFDEKFSRCLLNHYNYGFKNLSHFTQSQQTVHDNWSRLNSVVSDYLEWSNWEERKKVMFASADSQSMEENPFHRVYRFCKYVRFTYSAYFLHTVAALNSKFSLHDGLDTLDLDDDQHLHLEDVLESQSKLKTSDLIFFYTEALALTEGDDKNKTPNRLDDLLLLGLVECVQYKSKGDRRWSLPKLTMGKILNVGITADSNFEHHLHSALEFFSKYYLLGEVVTFLLDRFCDGKVSLFQFRHEYFMQSLNDFNIVDLLYAIENGKWCKIKYSHGTADFETELLCYPLEIRVSNMQGREFLMYYEPFRRSYTALRIEFIDSIEYFEDKKVKSILTQEEYHTSSESVDADIANARKSMQYSWGVATTKNKKKTQLPL